MNRTHWIAIGDRSQKNLCHYPHRCHECTDADPLPRYEPPLYRWFKRIGCCEKSDRRSLKKCWRCVNISKKGDRRCLENRHCLNVAILLFRIVFYIFCGRFRGKLQIRHRVSESAVKVNFVTHRLGQWADQNRQTPRNAESTSNAPLI
jgi:hypothetical protein